MALCAVRGMGLLKVLCITKYLLALKIILRLNLIPVLTSLSQIMIPHLSSKIAALVKKAAAPFFQIFIGQGFSFW